MATTRNVKRKSPAPTKTQTIGESLNTSTYSPLSTKKNADPCCDNCGACPMCQRPWWKPKSYVPALVILLFVGSFFLGMLLDKVQYLQAGGTAQGTTAGQQAAAGGNQQAPANPSQPVNVALGNFPIKGDSNAKVTIIEFADPRCPFCKQFFTDTEPQIIKNYVDTGKAKFDYRLFSFLGPASDTASNALECANEQGKFWELHDYFYQNQPNESDTSMFTVDNLAQIAGTLGMNTDQFRSCLSANKYNSKVSGDLADGQKAGVTGTPTVFINGIPVVGAQPYSAFQTIIDQQLAKK